MIVIPDLVGDPENMDSRLRGNDTISDLSLPMSF